MAEAQALKQDSKQLETHFKKITSNCFLETSCWLVFDEEYTQSRKKSLVVSVVKAVKAYESECNSRTKMPIAKCIRARVLSSWGGEMRAVATL